MLEDGGSTGGYGTSAAAPVAAACAAVLLEAFPAVTPAALEAALETSPTLVTDATNGLSFPRIDCRRAFEALGGSLPVPALSGRGYVALVAALAAAGLLGAHRRRRA